MRNRGAYPRKAPPPPAPPTPPTTRSAAPPTRIHVHTTWAPRAGTATREPRPVGYALLLLYLGIIFSRVLDMTVPFLRLPRITLILLTVCIAAAGNVALRALSSRTISLMIVFTAWIGVTASTGIWRSNSLREVTLIAITLLPVLAIVCFITSPERLKKALTVIAFALLLAACLSVVYGRLEQGRLALVVGTFGDPNTYALALLLSVPLWILVMSTSNKWIVKIFAIFSILLILRTVLYTGSRGALIAFSVLAFLLFLRVPSHQKILIAIMVPLLLIAGYVVLPEYLKVRYRTLLSSDVKTSDSHIREREGADNASTEGRIGLVKSSLRLTLEHPLLGVGPGNFPTANFDIVDREQHKKIWLVSHNSYTQISSENGIPGFIIFVSLVVMSLRNTAIVLNAAKKIRMPPLLVECARYLNVSMITVFTGAIFLSVAYDQMIYVLMALSVVVRRLGTEYMIAPVAATPVGIQVGPPAANSPLVGAMRPYAPGKA